MSVRREASNDYFVHDGERYAVKGRLGLEKASLVSDQVLIVNRKLFAVTGTAALVVDSDEAPALFRREIDDGTAIPIAATTSLRTNIDFVSPVLSTFGASLTLLGFALTGSLAGAGSRPAFEVAFLVGAVRWRALSRRVARLALLVVPLVGAGVAVRVGSTTAQLEWFPLVGLAGIQVLLAVIGYIVSVTRRPRGEGAWS
ncbi:hypothetical protein GCM10025867_11210 [Frondihabitans sucicola]|uniref:Uncharacterized protein n=1 Tax=Frondihabitans sucicola TaxID=1268041 RepID=A0ABM8GKG8_9MICO|nr:hypothetical protein [Frondihabitans sucicola]BDZ48880.1 hypothetical protein GCM10025867_11210 [Frondihabitans sucicola]